MLKWVTKTKREKESVGKRDKWKIAIKLQQCNVN